MTIYGQGAQGLADKEGIPVNEAQDVIDELMKAYPKLNSAIENAHNMAEHKHYVETISGFRRRLDTATSNDKSLKSRTLRQAFNAIVQGSGAYYTNTALIAIRKIFDELHLGSKLCITVHDSIVIDCKPEELEAVYQITTYVFSHSTIPELNNLPIGNLNVPDELKQSPTTYRFPMVGEAEIGLNYNDDVGFDLEEYKKFKSPFGYCKYNYELLKLKESLGMYDTDKYTEDDKAKKISELNEAIGILKSNKELFEQA